MRSEDMVRSEHVVGFENVVEPPRSEVMVEFDVVVVFEVVEDGIAILRSHGRANNRSV